MRASGRGAWYEGHKEAAQLTFDRLWPLCPHKIAPEELCWHCVQDEIPTGHPLSHKLAESGA